MIDIRPCQPGEILDSPRLGDLVAEYAAECAIDGMPKPDASFEMYRRLGESNLIDCFGAFDGDELVGFLVLLKTILPHYNQLAATTESFFVGKAHRKTGAGLGLLRMAEEFVKSVGAVGLLVSAPYNGQLSRVLPAAGYQQTNQVFFRKLTDD